MPEAALQPLWYDYVIVALLVIVLPMFTAFVTLPRVRRLPPDVLNRIRPRLYVEVMALQWLFIGAALYPVLMRGVPLEHLGISLHPSDLWRFFGTALLLLIAVFVVVRQREQIKQHPQGRDAVRAGFERVAWLLPRTRNERRLWYGISGHAGVGEELFFRGYLLMLLNFHLPFWAACVAMLIFFGVGHSYQGIRGVVQTALAGGLALVLFLLSGSLWLSIIAHALYDIHAGTLGQWALYGGDERPDGDG